MIISKKTIDTTPNGSTNLFQLPHAYITNSIIVIEQRSDNTVIIKNINELGGEYIEIPDAPANGSKLLIFYDYNDPSIEITSQVIENFKPWDSKRLLDLTQQLIVITTTIEKLTNSLKTKVTKEEMQSFVGPLYDEIKKLNIQHGAS